LSFLKTWVFLHPVKRSSVIVAVLLLCCVKERGSMTDDQLAEMLSRHKVARLIQRMLMVLKASHTILPAACWYAAKVFWACSRAKKIKVSNCISSSLKLASSVLMLLVETQESL